MRSMKSSLLLMQGAIPPLPTSTYVLCMYDYERELLARILHINVERPNIQPGRGNASCLDPVKLVANTGSPTHLSSLPPAPSLPISLQGGRLEKVACPFTRLRWVGWNG